MVHHMRLQPLLIVVVTITLLALQGCGSVSYYTQSINGHLKLVSAGQAVDKLIDDPTRAPDLREQLKLARDIRQFAIDTLNLPDNNSYRNYVDTHRQFVTWAVFAAPKLSLNVRTWCFPVAGCVPYRGYFSQEKALEFADGLRDEGLDVYVGGVPAYSTLGWFNDPLLNTMFLRGEPYLAGVVFHELSHQQVYVPNDTAFNEAFATAVEHSGTVAWLKHRNDRAAQREYLASQKRNDDFLALIANGRKELGRIYASQMSDGDKLKAKAAAIEKLRARYRQVKTQRWRGYSGYDLWFSEPINNAKLATVAVYNDLLPAFSRLLKTCHDNYDRFYNTVQRIARLDPQQRLETLNSIARCD